MPLAVGAVGVLSLALLSAASADSVPTLQGIIENITTSAMFATKYARDISATFCEKLSSRHLTYVHCDLAPFDDVLLHQIESGPAHYPVLLLNRCSPNLTSHDSDRFGATVYLVTATYLQDNVVVSVMDSLKASSAWRARSPLIFVQAGPALDMEHAREQLLKNFKKLWRLQILNARLILRDNTTRQYMYNPYLNKLVTLGKFDSRSISHQLNNMTRNLFGYEIKFCLSKKFLRKYVGGDEGCAMELVRTITSELNASCRVQPPRDRGSVGELGEGAGAATGATADLLRGLADLEVSSRILRAAYRGRLDTTYPVAEDHLCFLVPKQNSQSSFKAFTAVLSPLVLSVLLCCTIITIVSAVLVLRKERVIVGYELERMQGAGALAVELLKVFLRQAVALRFPGPAFRLLVLAAALYSLVINCAIDGILTTAITYPRRASDMDTLQEVTDSNLSVVVLRRHALLYRQSLPPHVLQQLQHRIREVDEEQLTDLVRSRDLSSAILLKKSEATFVSRVVVEREGGVPLYHMVAECPVPCLVVHALRLGSPLLPRVSHVLGALSAAGVLQHWADLDTRRFYRAYRASAFGDTTGAPAPLRMTNLEGVFYLWATGATISILVFFGELITRWIFQDI